ncbi:MAG: chlorite dismutase family protein [Anaerolineae bacterium]
MPEQRTLNQFALFSLTDAYWQLTTPEQHALTDELEQQLQTAAEAVHTYRIYPTRTEADLLVWSACVAEDSAVAQTFFRAFGRAVQPFRRYLAPRDSLWGFTRRSTYAGGRSAQEIDPFSPDRKPYLVIYPFAKTTEWYLMSRDARQGMMNEHIRIGREYEEITQLLLYATGLEDSEFVVSYETDNLARFSELVVALRATEARRYTLRDTPIYTAVHEPLREILVAPAWEAQAETMR